jgi:hypothetical protein
MSITDIHARAERFQTRIRWRNWSEYLAAVFVAGVFGYGAISAPSLLLQIGNGLVAAAAIYVSWRMHQLAHPASRGDLAQAVNCAEFHRAELVRQRDALRSVWTWYLAPFVPGLVVFAFGIAFVPGAEVPIVARLAVAGLTLASVALVFAAIAWLNASAAKKLQAEIECLDLARRPPAP